MIKLENVENVMCNYQLSSTTEEASIFT